MHNIKVYVYTLNIMLIPEGIGEKNMSENNYRKISRVLIARFDSSITPTEHAVALYSLNKREKHVYFELESVLGSPEYDVHITSRKCACEKNVNSER